MPQDTTDVMTGFTRDVAERLAAGWEGRRAEIESIMSDVRGRMIRSLDPRPGDTLLELAAGTGDTGLDAAERVGPDGRLICSDISQAMLDGARRRGEERGAVNVDYRVLDAQRIDLHDGAVDGVLCRLGYMLMPDPATAFAEARRVLRPGGRMVLTVWGPPDRNPFFSIPVAALVRRGHVPPPDPPPAPGLFALADPARTAALLQGAGFRDVRTEEVPVTFPIPDARGHVALIADTAGPLALALASLPDEDRAALTADVARAIAPFAANGGGHAVPGLALVTTAR